MMSICFEIIRLRNSLILKSWNIVFSGGSRISQMEEGHQPLSLGQKPII